MVVINIRKYILLCYFTAVLVNNFSCIEKINPTITTVNNYIEDIGSNILNENIQKKIIGYWNIKNSALESRFYLQEEYERSIDNQLSGKAVKIDENLEMTICENKYHIGETNIYNAIELSNLYRFIYNSVLELGNKFYDILYVNNNVERDAFHIIISETTGNVYIYVVYLDNDYDADCDLYLLEKLNIVAEKG